MAGQSITRGSVVLARYPFTDLSGEKLRPTVIVIPDSLIRALEDVLCAFITSTIPEKLLSTDLYIQPTDAELIDTGLKTSSVIRAHKRALLHRSLIHRQLGRLSQSMMAALDQCLIKAVGVNVP
ncbi:type II toxin-antitoxin system PemK/MazF family toxin [candidate division KSB1 bacterium]|nr:type II toxin-antitoxin system PemK/MazF family toxin [candidate division KSB1 bacterium]